MDEKDGHPLTESCVSFIFRSVFKQGPLEITNYSSFIGHYVSLKRFAILFFFPLLVVYICN